METILTTTKGAIGIAEELLEFDLEILMNINSAVSTLTQLGVGPERGFLIDEETEWGLFGNEPQLIGFIKQYVLSKVKLSFDPPQMGYLVTALEKRIQELEFRINQQVERRPPKC